MKPTIIIGSDHAGYRIKKFIVRQLSQASYAVEDQGPFDEQSVDAGVYALAVSEAVAARSSEALGILICGTGIGMSMMANKVKGIRASLVADLFSAKMARAHNHANVLCLGARVVAAHMAWEIAKVWLDTLHAGGKYGARVLRMMEYEQNRS